MDIGETNILEAEQFARQEFDKYYIKNGIQLSNKISYAAYLNNRTIEEYRNKGIGSRLINEVENYCRNRGVSHISLNTYEFQAPEFYKKMGYTVEFISKSKIRKELDKYYFIKYLQ